MGTKEQKFDLLVRVRDEASAALIGITGNVLKMVAGFAAIRTVTGFLKDSVAAAIESEAVFNDLGASIERHGGNWDSMKEAMSGALQVMMRDLGQSDEALARSTQVFIDYGANAHEALKLVAAAADLAAGKNIALETATDMLAKATAGNTILFSRYGFELDKTTGSATALNQVLGWIEEKWSGAAQAKMQTAAGQLKLLNEQYGELQENLGGLVSGPMIPFLDKMNDLLYVFNNTKRSLSDLVEVLKVLGANAILPVIGPAILLGSKLDDVTAAADTLAESQMDIFARFPDFNNALSEHAKEAEKVAYTYNKIRSEWREMMDDYQTRGPAMMRPPTPRRTGWTRRRSTLRNSRRTTRRLTRLSRTSPCAAWTPWSRNSWKVTFRSRRYSTR
jgi:hypothetical protein